MVRINGCKIIFRTLLRKKSNTAVSHLTRPTSPIKESNTPTGRENFHTSAMVRFTFITQSHIPSNPWPLENLTKMNETYYFSQIALSNDVVQWQADARLMVPHFAHDVVEETHDADAAMRVFHLELGKDSGSEVHSERRRNVKQWAYRRSLFVLTTFKLITNYMNSSLVVIIKLVNKTGT